MKVPPFELEKVKFALGAIVVAAAFCIMFPGFLSFAAGLGRMLTIIGVALAFCLILAFAKSYLSANRQPARPPDPSASKSETDKPIS